jgi:hypothetical protein
MGTELVPEMLIFNQMTLLLAQEDFINGDECLTSIRGRKFSFSSKTASESSYTG